MDYVIGVDIGGTFTDCVILDSNGKLTIGKALSTPHDFSLGVVDSLEDGAANLGLPSVDALLRSTHLFFHACTVADNTLITRTGARTGLVVTQGFPDTFLMMRGNVTHGLTEAEGSHIAALEKPEPLAPRSLTEQVQGRIDYKGSVLIDADDRQIEEVVERLVTKGVESVAVCLLWSIANDAHEKAVADVIRRKHPRDPCELLQRRGAVPGGVRAHRHDHFQRLYRAPDRVLPAQPSAKASRTGGSEATPW